MSCSDSFLNALFHHGDQLVQRCAPTGFKAHRGVFFAAGFVGVEVAIHQGWLGGNPATLESMKYQFYQYLPGIKSAIMDSLKDKGMYRVDPFPFSLW